MQRACVVFEDPFADRLRPMNLARPTALITCGASTLTELLADLNLEVWHHLRAHLRQVTYQAGARIAEPTEGPALFVNAALAPDLATIARLKELADAGEPFVALNDQRLTAALCPTGLPPSYAERSGAELVSYLLAQRLPVIDDEFVTFDYTFDVIRHHERLLAAHLERLLESGRYRPISEGVYVGRGADVAANVVFDASDGPIVLGDDVRIGPFSFLAGPVRVGDHCRIIDHAAIKHGSVLGHTVKAGGEIEASVIEPFSNKQHHGFLGHSYVGSWVNLGAGTSNSDLKNTYGEIAVETDGGSTPTGMQFLGCVIGDYTKTAINTSIFTGKLIGAASFLYGFVTTNVPSFTNYARSFGQVTEVSVEVALKTQARAARRRGVELSAADRRLMYDLFDLTRQERQLSSEQVVL